MKLSPLFFITIGYYFAFFLVAELNPILKISECILPILILTALAKKELKIFFAIDGAVFTYGCIRFYPVVESVAKAAFNIVELTTNLETSQIIAVLYCYLILVHYWSYAVAHVIIKKKHIKERVAKVIC